MVSKALRFLLGTLEKWIDFQSVLSGTCQATALLENQLFNVNI